MTIKKKINISLHPIELSKLDRIADKYGETRSGMLTRIIQEFPEEKHTEIDSPVDSNEIRFKIQDKKKKEKKTPKEYEEIDEIGELSGKGLEVH